MTNNNDKKQRIISIDLLKCFAIILVVMGHYIQFLIKEGDYADKVGYRLIYSFHMPLFMMLSGFFAVKLQSIDFKTMLRKKFTQLLRPALIFGLIICISEQFINGGGLKLGIYINCLWFLKSAFLCSIIYWSYCRLSKFSSIFALLSTLLISQAITFFQVNYMYPCFLIGTYLNHRYNSLKQSRNSICLLSFLVFVLMLLSWDDSFWQYRNTFWGYSILPIEVGMQFEFWFKHLYRLLIGIAGSLFFFSLAEIAVTLINTDSKLIRVATEIGQVTLAIYMLQSIFLEQWMAEVFDFSHLPPLQIYVLIMPLISISIIAVCMLTIRVLRKTPYVSHKLFNI